MIDSIFFADSPAWPSSARGYAPGRLRPDRCACHACPGDEPHRTTGDRIHHLQRALGHRRSSPRLTSSVRVGPAGTSSPPRTPRRREISPIAPPEHGDRYDRARANLWRSSSKCGMAGRMRPWWASQDTGIWTDTSRLRPPRHNGEHFSVAGVLRFRALLRATRCWPRRDLLRMESTWRLVHRCRVHTTSIDGRRHRLQGAYSRAAKGHGRDPGQRSPSARTQLCAGQYGGRGPRSLGSTGSFIERGVSALQPCCIHRPPRLDAWPGRPWRLSVSVPRV